LGIRVQRHRGHCAGLVVGPDMIKDAGEKAREGRMIMSGSWCGFGPETERKNPPLGRVGCKRRLTRHDWNGGNNYLADEMQR
jgi:hypothetical protein